MLRGPFLHSTEPSQCKVLAISQHALDAHTAIVALVYSGVFREERKIFVHLKGLFPHSSSCCHVAPPATDAFVCPSLGLRHVEIFIFLLLPSTPTGLICFLFSVGPKCMYTRVLNSGKRHLLTMNPPFSQTARHTQFGGPPARRQKEIPANDTRIPIVYCVFSFGTNYDGFHGRIGAFSSKIASLFRLFSHT